MMINMHPPNYQALPIILPAHREINPHLAGGGCLFRALCKTMNFLRVMTGEQSNVKKQLDKGLAERVAKNRA